MYKFSSFLIAVIISSLFLPVFGQTILKQKNESIYDNSQKVIMQIVDDFDTKGLLIKRGVLDGLGKVIKDTVYQVNIHGLVSSKLVYEGVAKKLTHTDLFLYDGKGEIKELKSKSEGEEFFVETFTNTYDEHNNLIKVKQKYVDLYMEWLFEFKYTSNNLLSKKTSTFQNELKREQEYVYEKDLLVEELDFSYENMDVVKQPTFKSKYTYDQIGNLVEKKIFTFSEMDSNYFESLKFVHKYTYDKNNKLSVEEVFEDNVLVSKSVFSYLFW